MSAKRRIEFIDIAKGIAIFLVVWGHTATNNELQGADCGLLYRVIYSLHMPLFFFLSGLSISTKPLENRDEWKSFLKKIILSIALPYFVWALIYCTFTYANVAWIAYGSWYALNSVTALSSLWYLSCLFVARLFVELVLSFTNRKLWWPFVIAFLAIGILLPKISIGYPWCADVAFVAAGCILLGALLKKPLIELSVQKIWLLTLLIVISAGIYVASVFIDGNDFAILMMCKGQYGSGVGQFIRAIAGGFAVLALSMILRQLAESVLSDRQISPLIYIGQYTMGVFLLHKPLMQQVIIPILTSISGDAIADGIIRFLSALIAVAVSLPVCNIIKHYIPELIGINRN